MPGLIAWAQLAYAMVCGVLAAVFAVLTGYFGWARYLTASVGLLVLVLALAMSPWGSVRFWHDAILGAAIFIAALLSSGPEPVRRGRDIYGHARV